jgi:hypothetical protein
MMSHPVSQLRLLQKNVQEALDWCRLVVLLQSTHTILECVLMQCRHYPGRCERRMVYSHIV